ncbi:MAG TPA: ATP-binding cassette domain-containing protein, partial [Steroidobacter sp.]|nr:ATP-binding cassette domain-containing protein [Steroidobacter sp.]
MLDTLTRAPVTNTLLYLDAVSVSFDGFKALNDLSLVLEHGEMRAIIGPNGAGKTTMMDVVTGKTRPDIGTVLFDGRVDLTREDEAAIAELGIGRKFQKPTVFESHSVADNILLALRGPRDPLSALFGARNRMPRERIDTVLETVKLADLRERQ